MAADNSVELKIKVTEDQKDLYSKLKNSYKEVGDKGAFRGERGAAAKAKIESNLGAIENAINKGVLSKGEQKVLNQAFVDTAKVLKDFAAKIVNLSPAAKKLQNEIGKVSENIEKLEAAKIGANTNKINTLKSFKDLDSLGIYKKKKDGSLSKVKYNNANFLEQYTNNKDIISNVGFKYKGKITEFNNLPQEIKDTIEYYLQLLKSIKTINDKLTKAKQVLQSKSDQLEKEISNNPKGDTTAVSHTLENVAQAYNIQSSTEDSFASAEVNDQVKELNVNIAKQQTLLGKAFKQFTLYNAVLRTVKTALREAANTIVSLDKSLTEQAMVTGKSRDEVYSLLKSYQNLASQIGATTKEVAEAASEFLKQGKTIQDSLTLSEAAVSAAKVAGVSVSDSINYLTTALNGFKLSANDAISVSDKFAAVAASSASDYDEIAIALSKVASQANLAGMSIDYTTALLTTGLEVTREAPETMGTALKTIIARMREISDYGETLEDGTDLNNVETQLNYIGIQLTNNSGELRSTEDVLDELGQKWSTLSSNQQAAVAKALAGTRQQSRLIAMMDNYDRVLELQKVSERSSGATAAQLEKYMEGIEASLNKVSVAWEKIVTTFTNSKLITRGLDTVAGLLEYVNNFFDNVPAQIALVTVLVTMAASLIAKKQLENNIAKEQLEIQRQEQIMALEAQTAETEREAQKEITKQKEIEMAQAQQELNEAIADEQNAAQEKAIALTEKQYLEQKKLTLEAQATNAAKENSPTAGQKVGGYRSQISQIDSKLAANTASLTAAEQKLTAAKEKQAAAQTKINNINTKYEAQQKKVNKELLETNNVYKLQKDQIAYLSNQTSLLSNSILKLVTLQNLEKLQTLGLTAVQIVKLGWMKLTNKEQYEAIVATKLQTQAETENAVASTNTAAAKGVETGAHIANTAAVKAETAALKLLELNPLVKLAAVAIAAVTAIYALYKWISSLPSETEKAADTIGTLTNEIYELNQSQTAIASAIAAWEEYDNKLIKTKEDAEELSETLSSVSDSLTEDQQEIYKSATSNRQRNDLLKSFSAQNKTSINQKWTEVVSTINGMSEKGRQSVLQDLSSITDQELLSQATRIQSSITAKNNQDLYDTIDSLTDLTTEQADAVEDLTQSILENMSAQEQWAMQQNGGVKKFVQAIAKSKDALDAFEEFENSENSLTQKLGYYQQICKSLEGNSAALKSFQDLYQQYAIYSTMDEDVLKLIEDLGITDDQINTLYNSYSTLIKEGVDITEEDYKARFNTLLETFAETKDVAMTIKSVFGDIVTDDNWNDLVKIFDTLEESLLNIGQNMENFDNKISAFYEKASSWGDLTDSDKAEFFNDNADLFKGEDGQKLYQAFINQDYEQIQEALSTNKNLKEIYQARLAEIETAISVEEAKTGDEYNGAYVAYLKSLKKHLEDVDNLYAASLETRLEQEENQLEKFKSLLESQEDLIKDSLDKRKEAYQNYFNTINEEADTEDYEKTAQQYLNNLSGIGASTDANSQAQRKNLEDKLEDLEKDRLKTLRENAQNAVISNIENEINAIGDKFDKLLNNSNQMLQLMNGNLDSDKAGFFSQLIANSAYNGSTANGLQNFLQTLQSTYGNKLNGVDLSDIKITQDTNNNLILNVNGETYNLNTSDEKSLYETIYAALQKLGVK